MLWKSIIILLILFISSRKANDNGKEFYLEKLDVYMVLISVFLCWLLLVFYFLPYNDLFLLPVFLEPAVFFLSLVTYYFYFDWDETIYRTDLGLGLIVQVSLKSRVFFFLSFQSGW